MSEHTDMSVPRPQGLRVPAEGREQREAPALVPAVDIVEDENGIVLYADLPGVSKDRLDIRIEGDSLLIEAQASVHVPEGLKVLHAEMREPHYRRVFTLSPELDASRIDANLKDGVLTLRLPRTEQAKPRRIDVTVN
ncbi:MAG TPA: Hsp20/alpha crystallin family protein [Steroidobacteraceae bacterium]|jgi:HSP20 family molecular chaperone IbpA|nr:Hsp20/alpha crystallin family protein [Steroidobacteraceae bacterium]